MSVYRHIKQVPPFGAILIFSLVSRFERLFDSIEKRRIKRQTMQELSMLDDHILKDIGLTRSEIYSLNYNG